MTDNDLELIGQFPLWPIRDDRDYDQAAKALADLAARADDPGLTEVS